MKLSNLKKLNSGYCIALIRKTCMFSIVVLIFELSNLYAQPPGHDPSRVIRDGDRYYTFCTGDGIWTMSSSNPYFTDWQAETSPFAGGWPSWINNYVSGFEGFFWAPECIYMNSRYYLYYSCSMGQKPCAIGVASTASLSNPSWTDHGMVVYSDNNTEYGSIDPDVFFDQSGRLWLVWGSHLMGIVLTELNPSTGKPYNASNYYHLANYDCEAASIVYHSGYYYLFFNRYDCCAGVNSTYTIFMGRSTSVTGPYLDKYGNDCANYGGSVFLESDGRYIGPGHFGYGEGRLTYHFYDGYDNGAAKINNTTLGWQYGWPVAGVTGDDDGSISGTYALIASHSSKALDVYAWGTDNGTNIVQWTYWGGATQQFNIYHVDGIWHEIESVLAPGKALDVYGISTENGANINLWEYWGGYGQQFKFENAGSGLWRIINRNSGKCIDIENFSTDDGANAFQWTCITGNPNQMFSLVDLKNASEAIVEPIEKQFSVYPNPLNSDILYINSTFETNSVIEISIYNSLGQKVYSESIDHQSNILSDYQINTNDLSKGIYLVNVRSGKEIYSEKLIVE